MVGRLSWSMRALERGVIGNDAGVVRTVRGSVSRRRARLRGPARHSASAPAEAVAEFRRTGVLRVDPPEGPGAATAVQQRVAGRLTSGEGCRDLGPPEEPWLHRYVVDAHLAEPSVCDLLDPGVVRSAEAALDCGFRVRSVRVYRNLPPTQCRDDDSLYANLWHLDPNDANDLRFFVYLRPTTRRSGALETVDRRTTRRVLVSGYLDKEQIRGPARRIIDRRAVVHEGPAGTGVLVDAQRVLHRAGVCAPGTYRDIVQFWLTPSVEPFDPGWADRLGPDPAFHGGGPGDG